MLILGIESSCDETGVALVRSEGRATPQLLSHALYSDNTVEKGRIVQSNFNDFRVLRQNESPVIDITLVKSNEKPGGTGEPSTSLIGAAVGNAVFAATGKRLRELPLRLGKGA